VLDLITDSIVGARGKDSLNSALGEDPLLLRLIMFENDRHLLHVRVERELGNLVPLRLLSCSEAETVPVKSRGKDLDGNLSGVATAMPFALNLMDSGEVSQRSNVQVFLECEIPGNDLLGIDGGAFGVTKLEVDVLGLSILETKLSLGGVEGLASSAD
jgi:hypothetical protein